MFSALKSNLSAVQDNLIQHMQVKQTIKLYFGTAFPY